MIAKIGNFSKSKHKLYKFASNLCLFDEKCIKIIVWCCKIALLDQLLIDRVGIDAEEDVVKGIEVGHLVLFELSHLVEHCHVFDEQLFLHIGIILPVGVVAMQHIVGDVVVWPKSVMAYDALVDELCHLLMILVGSQAVECRQFVFPDLWANLEVYSALGLSDAREDACDIFAWAFDVFLIAADI